MPAKLLNYKKVLELFDVKLFFKARRLKHVNLKKKKKHGFYHFKNFIWSLCIDQILSISYINDPSKNRRRENSLYFFFRKDFSFDVFYTFEKCETG